MRIFILSLCLMALTNFSFAQGELPLNESTGHAEYTEVVEVDGATTDKLYKRLEHWYNQYFKNPGSVIEEANAGKNIKGKHFIMIYNEVNGKKNLYGKVRYFIDVAVRDGRYKYTVNEIYLYQVPKIYIEEWLDESKANADVNRGYLTQVQTEITALIDDLKATMGKPIPSEAADDW